MGYNVQFFGIYPDEIEHATEIADEACIEAGLDPDVLFDFDFDYDIVFDLKHCVGDWDDITGSVIRAYFGCCCGAIQDKLGEENVEVDWYINGWDTHFYIKRLDTEDEENDEA